MALEKRNSRRNSIARRRESNEEVRARFEKEAHDREIKEILEYKEGYNRWVNENSMRQLMYK